MSFKMTEKDNGFGAFIKSLDFADKMRVRVGAVGQRSEERVPGEDLSYAELLAVHEFGADTGTAKIPQRRPLRDTADTNRRKYERHIAGIVKKITKAPESTNVKAELEVLGERVRKDVIKHVKAGGAKPDLSDRYKRRKTREGWPSTPLIRTGELIGSIGVEVSKK